MAIVRNRKHSSLAFVWMYGCGDELIRMPVSFPYAVDVPVPEARVGGRETALFVPRSGSGEAAQRRERRYFTLLRADASYVSERNGERGRRAASGRGSSCVEGDPCEGRVAVADDAQAGGHANSAIPQGRQVQAEAVTECRRARRSCAASRARRAE